MAAFERTYEPQKTEKSYGKTGSPLNLQSCIGKSKKEDKKSDKLSALCDDIADCYLNALNSGVPYQGVVLYGADEGLLQLIGANIRQRINFKRYNSGKPYHNGLTMAFEGKNKPKSFNSYDDKNFPDVKSYHLIDLNYLFNHTDYTNDLKEPDKAYC